MCNGGYRGYEQGLCIIGDSGGWVRLVGISFDGWVIV